MNTCGVLKIKPTKEAIFVSISEKKLYFYEQSMLKRVFPISTSKNPPSCRENSLGTPQGLHAIARKIGGGIPLGGVLKGRVYTGRHFSEFSVAEKKENLISTRILWLNGLEAGKNRGPGCDTFKRHIYIHGTNREDRLGQAQTAGCVAMSNCDILELYDKVEVKTLVQIQ